MKIKDYVYGYDSYGNLQEGKIKQFLESNGVEYVKFGTGVTLPKSRVFLSKEDCIKCYNKNFNDKVVNYCKSISTVEDLVTFMFNHCVSCAEEYTDWEAREACQIKAKELLGLDLNVY